MEHSTWSDDAAGEPEFVPTLVVGGGQGGLAVGYELARRGRSFLILDAHDRVGDAWRQRWDSLHLFTPARYNGLPGMPFPCPAHAFPTKDEMADYLEAYAARFELPIRTDVCVDRVARDGDRFVVSAGKRRFAADRVVVATGAYQTPRAPDFDAEIDPAIVQRHSSEYRNPSQLRSGGVLVVGAGNSGAEIALEASRDHPTWLSGRDTGHEPARPGTVPDRLLTPVLWFMAFHVLTVRTPIGRIARRYFRRKGIPLVRVRRKDLAAAGVESVPRTAGVRDGLPELDDGRVLDVTNVVWCTGFVPDYRWIELPILGEDGYPEQERGVAASQPGLYFMGLLFQYSLSSVLVGGVGRDAEWVAEHIASQEKGDPPRDVAPRALQGESAR